MIEKDSIKLKEIKIAIRDYYTCVIETNTCAELMLFNPIDTTPAKIMQRMYKAQSRMFQKAGIDYYGGSEKRK